MPITQKRVLIVGLGNPGLKYQFTRHNLGFRVLERLREELALPAFKLNKSLKSALSEGQIGDKVCMLLLPQTYMNLSGSAVLAAKKKFSLRSSQIWLVHDDKDLKLGDLRVISGGSSAGHKGVDSAVTYLGTKNFRRYRLGIGTELAQKMGTDKFVLAKFLPEEEPSVRNYIDKVSNKIIEDLGVTR